MTINNCHDLNENLFYDQYFVIGAFAHYNNYNYKYNLFIILLLKADGLYRSLIMLDNII